MASRTEGANVTGRTPEGARPARAQGMGSRGKVALFAIVAVAWIVLDRATKAAFAGMEPSGILAGPFLGIIDINLVHNTGAAWGMFAGSTTPLGVLAVVVCAALAAFFFYDVRNLGVLETLGIALIVAGGVGNAVDRFAQGFVTDFLEFSFFDFPVFNIADCGVTCGFVLLFVGLAIGFARGGTDSGADGAAGPVADGAAGPVAGSAAGAQADAGGEPGSAGAEDARADSDASGAGGAADAGAQARSDGRA